MNGPKLTKVYREFLWQLPAKLDLGCWFPINLCTRNAGCCIPKNFCQNTLRGTGGQIISTLPQPIGKGRQFSLCQMLVNEIKWYHGIKIFSCVILLDFKPSRMLIYRAIALLFLQKASLKSSKVLFDSISAHTSAFTRFHVSLTIYG